MVGRKFGGTGLGHVGCAAVCLHYPNFTETKTQENTKRRKLSRSARPASAFGLGNTRNHQQNNITK
jgi:hypothetical protein